MNDKEIVKRLREINNEDNMEKKLDLMKKLWPSIKGLDVADDFVMVINGAIDDILYDYDDDYDL